MDAGNILETVKNSGLANDQFWYVYAVVVTALLVLLTTGIVVSVKGFLASFLKDIKDTNQKFSLSIEKLTENDSKLTEMVKLHEVQIKYIEEDIKEMKDTNKRRRQ